MAFYVQIVRLQNGCVSCRRQTCEFSFGQEDQTLLFFLPEAEMSSMACSSRTRVHVSAAILTFGTMTIKRIVFSRAGNGAQ
jgi:hypothetical protein